MLMATNIMHTTPAAKQQQRQIHFAALSTHHLLDLPVSWE
jgi:hypothetical protein